MSFAETLLKEARRITADNITDVAKTLSVPTNPHMSNYNGQTFETFAGILPRYQRTTRFGQTLADPRYLPPASGAKVASWADARQDAIPGAGLGAAAGLAYGATRDRGPGQSQLNDALFYGLVGATGGAAAGAVAGQGSRYWANHRAQQLGQDVGAASGAIGRYLDGDPQGVAGQMRSDVASHVLPAAADTGAFGWKLHRAVGRGRDAMERGLDAADAVGQLNHGAPTETRVRVPTVQPDVSAQPEKSASTKLSTVNDVPTNHIKLYAGSRTEPTAHDSEKYRQAVLHTLASPGYSNYERLRSVARTARTTFTPSLAHAKNFAGPGGWITELIVPQSDVHSFHVAPLRSDTAGRSTSFEIDHATLDQKLSGGLWRKVVRRNSTDSSPGVSLPSIVGLPGQTKTSSELVRRRVEVVPMDRAGRVLVGGLEGHPEIVVVPGGGCKPSESLYGSAVRELWEETGFRPKALVRINATPVPIPTPSSGPGKSSNWEETTFYLGIVDADSGQTPPGPGPLTRLRWLDWESAMRQCGPSSVSDPWGANRALRAHAVYDAHKLFEEHFSDQACEHGVKTALALDGDEVVVYTQDLRHVVGVHPDLPSAGAQVNGLRKISGFNYGLAAGGALAAGGVGALVGERFTNEYGNTRAAEGALAGAAIGALGGGYGRALRKYIMDPGKRSAPVPTAPATYDDFTQRPPLRSSFDKQAYLGMALSAGRMAATPAARAVASTRLGGKALGALSQSARQGAHGAMNVAERGTSMFDNFAFSPTATVDAARRTSLTNTGY